MKYLTVTFLSEDLEEDYKFSSKLFAHRAVVTVTHHEELPDTIEELPDDHG